MKVFYRYRVYFSSNSIAQVEDPETSRKWVVDFDKKLCDCTDFYQFQSPCSHAIAAARILRIDPIDYFVDWFTAEEYRKTYRRSLLPVSMIDLPRDNSIQPPIVRKSIGRPRSKRIRKGTWNRRQTRCGNCLDWGHNRRRCTNQPVASRRRQRAWEWLQSEDEREDEGEDEGEDREDEDEEEEERLDRELGIQIEEVDQLDSDSELSEVNSEIFVNQDLVDIVLPLRYATRSGREYGMETEE